ncbi:bifunctional RNase H/acid phosphatase [Luteipulveratus flavus]|uniref:Bifunctional RNase H/acid phosphatase n=1 Tax=Luteipulveratus flavus TaxID=3031728 RepID=A0ABT6C3X6_9MICO|nr:bifunctional RNase H/acid phosphatase [Luteipulveratus sp. YIM 133296]MDF8263425.1 bifunctional RNase H/acid phosphatase [Luteipulveratus sp. YIM 133296]
MTDAPGEARELVVEADGGSRGNPGVAGYGALVRDSRTGRVLAERAAPLGRASNNVAEYSGLIAGLAAAEAIDPVAVVEVRMDSKLVIEQMAGRWKIKHADMQRLAAEANEAVRRRRAAGGSVTWTWIPRESNKAADRLSNDGMDGRTVERDLWRSETAAGEDVAAVEEQVLSTEPTPGTPPDVSAPTLVLLVRHGVTDFTVQGRLDGRGGADPSLNAAGRDQADRAGQALADRLHAVSAPVTVVTSSLARAQETGAAVAAALGVRPVEDADWDEQAFGDWDGERFADLARAHGEDLRRLRVDESFAVAGGESHRGMAQRVEQAMQRVVGEVGPGGTAVVVTHRMPIMAVLASVLGLTRERAWALAAAPASVTGVELWRDGTVQIAFVNDTHHLDG